MRFGDFSKHIHSFPLLNIPSLVITYIREQQSTLSHNEIPALIKSTKAERIEIDEREADAFCR